MFTSNSTHHFANRRIRDPYVRWCERRTPSVTGGAVYSISVSVTELRIGNLLKFGNNICKVYEINNVNYYIRNEKTDESLKSSWANIEPILITEEWLLKFGFEWTDYDEENPDFLGLKYRNRDLFYTDRSCNFEYVSFNNSILGVININYVHQLQNLYFTLTGSELQIVDLTEH